MDASSNQHEASPPRQHDDGPPVARQAVKNPQSMGRALQREDDTTAQVAHGLPRSRRAKSRRARIAYWPTTPLTREQMAGAVRIADRQDEAVLLIFRHYAGRELAPSQLLTSVRRAISTLTNYDALERGQRIHAGPNGRPEHTWRLPRGGEAA